MRTPLCALTLLMMALSTISAFAELSDSDQAQIVRLIQDFSSRRWWDAWWERAYWSAQIGLLFIGVGAAWYARNQVRLINRSREEQNFATILERTAEHNWKIAADDNCKKAVEIFANLHVPSDARKGICIGLQDSLI
jgi:hypothetical protein